jgi:ribosomal subunit interface protein
MAVRIDAKSTKLSESTKDHIEDACSKFTQFFERIIDIEVTLDTQEKHKHATSVEIIVKVPSQRIVGKGESTENNLFKAIDDAAHRVETQLKRYHDKLVEHR